MQATKVEQQVPRAALLGAAVLLGFALCATVAARFWHMNTTPLPLATPTYALQLNFRDRADGAVEVLNAARGNAVIHVVQPGTGGFVRGVLRGLARQRRRESVSEQPPFTLTSWSDGRLTLDDPQTRQHINLEVFGPDNAQPFADLFAANLAVARNASP